MVKQNPSEEKSRGVNEGVNRIRESTEVNDSI